jgi:hypothetical protein
MLPSTRQAEATCKYVRRRQSPPSHALLCASSPLGAHISSLRLLCWPLICTVDEKVKVVGSPKIPLAKDAAKHKAGGGNVEICQPINGQHNLL